MSECSKILKLYTLKALRSKNWFYFFFLSSYMQKLYITLSVLILYYFFKCISFFKFNMPNQKSNKNNSIRIIFIKIIIKINITKICIKNTHFITRKYDIIRTFTKIEYIIICVQSSKNILIILLVIIQSGISFNAARDSSTASSTACLSFIFIRTIYY